MESTKNLAKIKHNNVDLSRIRNPPTRFSKKSPPVLMGCLCSKNTKWTPGYEEPTILAAETPFTVSEVEALYELFKKLSSSIIDDGLIHKEELQLALFKNKNNRNLFADRLKEMVLALLHESDLILSENDVEMIVDKSFKEADTTGDGRIDPEEWKEFVSKNPSLIKNMTLPYLKISCIIAIAIKHKGEKDMRLFNRLGIEIKN
ncbi:hypothetical protein HYC85_001344 [Camellia sinensis]|uniref:Calcineurin B-like protein n=1 Tax=Camellia sinensis TaxID=4442 RepID=A0A7J7I5R5_CAMSI|nr:hypothetical protein HYC85_001344 [Camellia sinensis]